MYLKYTASTQHNRVGNKLLNADSYVYICSQFCYKNYISVKRFYFCHICKSEQIDSIFAITEIFHFIISIIYIYIYTPQLQNSYWLITAVQLYSQCQ